MKGKVLKPYSRSLRREQTEAESALWLHLRSRRFQGIKFRRQQPVGPYITDFCSLEEKIIVELDGSQHLDDLERDPLRTKFLEREGFRVIRVWDNEVFGNIEAVLEYIRLEIHEAPSP